MKRRKDFLQQECDAPGPVEPSNSPVNTDSNKSWDTEPNFNLNFNLSSPSNPRPTKDTSKMDSGSKKEDKSKGGGKTGNKGAVAVDFSTILLPAEKMKSKIPTFSSSQTAQTTVKNKGKPKYPHTENPSTSEIKIHGTAALSSKPNSVEVNLSQRPMEKVITEIPVRESAKPVPVLMPELATNSANVTPNLKTQANRKDGHVKEIHLETSSKTLQLPKSPKFFNKKGDKSNISPQITNRTPTMMAKTKKTDLVNSTIPFDQKVEDVYKAQGAFTSSKTAQGTPLSPKPSLLAKPTWTINSNVLGSKGSIKGKYSKAISRSKTTVQSSKSLKATKGSKDSLDSKSRSQSGSRDALDSKSSSASKSSVESRDSLDCKKLQRSKASPNSKLKTIFKDTHDQKTSKESKKIHQDSEKISASKMTNSKNNHDSKSLQSSRASFDPTIITSSGSESKTGVTNTTSLANLPTSSLDMYLLGCVSLSPISSGSIKTASSAVELRLNLKSQSSQSDPSRSEQVQSDSKSTPIDLSSSLRLSPVSASQNPGSCSTHFVSTSTGSNRENQKSPSSSPGNDNPSVKIQQRQGALAPLASSSPKTRPVVTSKTVEGFTHTSEVSAVTKRDPGSSSQNTCLTQGLTFDSITKLDNKAVKKYFRSSENKGQTQEGLEVSQKDKNIEKECPLGDNRKELDRLRKMEHPRDTNIILSPQATNVGEQKKKMQVHGKKNEDNCSSPLHPISSSSTYAPTKKKVKETAAKTESQRLHKLSGERKEVGVQVEVEVVECSVSTSPSLQQGPPSSSLIGSPSCQSSLSYLPPLKHVCQIEIELCSQSLLPSVVPEKASSLPACLRSYSFQQNPALMSEIGQDPNPDVSSESIWENENDDEKNPQANKANKDGFKGQTEKPLEVLWDKQGMTWEVYGASVDLESLGTAIQSHLEMKIREKERHIRILRKSICSNNSFTRCKLKKRRRRFLGCCVKASTVMD